jgi:group II intron reverse transcriptase/maturase
MVWTTLSHLIDVEFLREAYRRTRKNGAKGVDGRSADDFAADLEENLQSLLERFKSGTYKAPPVRRVHIPKGGGKTRPIGIPTFEDKVLQRAVAMVLAAVYEQDFMDCSHGFRPGRSPHSALEELRQAMMNRHGGWVLEVDITKYFDSIDPKHLRGFLEERVRDGVIRRTVDKWLKAGVMEEKQVFYPELGTPQGGVISPLLSNIYLHEVLDKWFEMEVRPRLHGPAFPIRFADDFIIVFTLEEDARRVMEVLPKRFGKYGLELHPEKTGLVPFRRPPKHPGNKDGGPSPGSFDFLGFTHFWARSRKGNWVIKRKTAKGRFARAVKAVFAWCRANRHDTWKEQHEALTLKLRGHYQFYGITGNSDALNRFYRAVCDSWRYWLSRRSQRAYVSWAKLHARLKWLPLPKPKCVHSALRNSQLQWAFGFA